MTKSDPDPKVADEVLWSDGITAYGDRHHETYLHPLDAEAEGVGKHEMGRLILGFDPTGEPERAHKAVNSHLARARWMTKVGYRHFLVGRHPAPSASGTNRPTSSGRSAC